MCTFVYSYSSIYFKTCITFYINSGMCFIPIVVVRGFVGISVVVLWVSAWGCAVVHGYWRGSIYLIFLKLCCALIYDLVRLFCFVFCLLVLFCFFFFSFIYLFILFYFIFVWLVVVSWEVEEEGYWGLDFFFPFLLLWFIVVAGGAMVEMVEVGDAIVLVFVVVVY